MKVEQGQSAFITVGASGIGMFPSSTTPALDHKKSHIQPTQSTLEVVCAGRALAVALASRVVRVTILDLQIPQGEETVRLVEEEHARISYKPSSPSAIFIRCDVTKCGQYEVISLSLTLLSLLYPEDEGLSCMPCL
jgi:hypothetical protein